MKTIIREPISQELLEQLQAKQERINRGERDHTWWELSRNQRTQIVEQLKISQGNLCCYCECEIADNNIHIEHFVERHDNTSRVYDYHNMLLSCEGDRNRPLVGISVEARLEDRATRIEDTTCGHKKTQTYHDNEEIDYQLLLNPTLPIITNLFSYIDGFVEPATDLLEEITQVEYTKKRLALNSA